MIYYSIQDIAEAYDIGRDKLKRQIKNGKLKSLKQQVTKNTFRYIIPANELCKLEEFKKHEPKFNPCSQPNYYLFKVSRNLQREEHGPFLQYRKYLQSEEWQIVRRKRLQIDGYKCQMCGTGKNLQVHHISYEHLEQEKEIDDLVTLCKECHKKVHEEDLR